MREIIFRGKRIDNGEWVYGCLANFVEGVCAHIHPRTTGTVEEQFAYCVNPLTLGQFTGLTDKNGTKVFVGDIVALGISRSHEIKFADGSFYMDGTAIPICHADKFSVIGNIYDNPKLLEQGRRCRAFAECEVMGNDKLCSL